jgi:DNA-directed RNA polymerase specialized sigma24 family protein
VSDEAIAERLGALERVIMALAAQVARQSEFQALVAHRLSDLSHVSVAEAAIILKCSERTVRRRIHASELTLETIPGRKEMGIPLRQVRPDWIDVRALATAKGRESRG